MAVCRSSRPMSSRRTPLRTGSPSAGASTSSPLACRTAPARRAAACLRARRARRRELHGEGARSRPLQRRPVSAASRCANTRLGASDLIANERDAPARGSIPPAIGPEPRRYGERGRLSRRRSACATTPLRPRDSASRTPTSTVARDFSGGELRAPRSRARSPRPRSAAARRADQPSRYGLDGVS